MQNLTERKAINRIIKVYKQSDKTGIDWYINSHELLWNIKYDHANVSYNKVVGICAALSPMKTWSQNIKILQDYLKTGKAKHTRVFQEKCDQIMLSDGSKESIEAILKGEKIVNFFNNLLDPFGSQAVTIDRHAIMIANLKFMSNPQVTKKQYQFYAQAYRKAAQKLCITPLELQACTWVHWRSVKHLY